LDSDIEVVPGSVKCPAMKSCDRAAVLIAEDGTLVQANRAFEAMVETECVEGASVFELLDDVGLGQRTRDVLAKLEGRDEVSLDSTADTFGVLQLKIAARRWGSSVEVSFLPHLSQLKQHMMWQSFFDIGGTLVCQATVDGCFEHLNERWEDVLGFSREELCAVEYEHFVHPDDVEQTRDAMERLARGEAVKGFRNRYRHANGGYRWLEWQSVRAIGDRVCAIAMDVSERVEQERHIQRKQASEMVAELAGGVAHDFNNLLSIVSGFASILRAELPSDSVYQADVEEIIDASDRAASLAKQLVAIGRESMLELEQCAPNDIVLGAIGLAASVLPPGFAMKKELSWSGSLETDPVALERIVLNILINARDVVDESGSIEVTTRPVTIGQGEHPRLAAGEYFEVRVADDGPGIPEEDQARIFQPYFTTKEDAGGTGLGLAVSHATAEQLGGELRVESEVGDGATFVLLLPVRETGQEVNADDGPATIRFESPEQRVVLAVDDQSGIRAVVARTLDRLGVRVGHAASGVEALSRVDAGSEFDVLVTGLQMPGMSGLELIRQLKVRDAVPEQIVVLGSQLPREETLDGLEQLPIAMLDMPIIPDQLVRFVSAALERSGAKRSGGQAVSGD
jgi:PAS domain S-box-containing protein